MSTFTQHVYQWVWGTHVQLFNPFRVDDGDDRFLPRVCDRRTLKTHAQL
ncbi:MAG: hypothetical protein PHX54_13810 [Lentimicrobiaceae bacterium]|nr:hypothetical protein [Lentimicrobiaceae bacterium]